MLRERCWWHSAGVPDQGEVWEEHRDHSSSRGQVSVSVTTHSSFFFLCDMILQEMVKNVHNLKILNVIQVLISCRALEVLNLFFNYIFNLRLEVWTLILFFSKFLFSIFKWFSNWLRMLKIYVPFILKRIKLSSLIISIIFRQ